MAEIKMDVDSASPYGFDSNADEDLIDYDTDTNEVQKQNSWSPQYDENNFGSTIVDAKPDLSLTMDSRMSETANGPEDLQEAVEDARQYRDMHDDNDHADVSIANTPTKQSPLPSGESLRVDVDILEVAELVQHTEVGTDQVAATTEAQGTDNEIDYEDDDEPVAQGSIDEQERLEDHVNEVGSTHDEEVAENASDSTPPSSTLQTPQDANASKPAAEMDQEITWEQVDKDEQSATAHDGTESFAETTLGAGNDGSDQENNTEILDQSREEHLGDIDFDQDDTIAGLEEDCMTTGQQEESTSQSNPSQAEDEGFPAITVHYKGDEFPFFSHATFEGFFSDLSVLDNNMESLLAGFRAELSNETAAEDVLVFQVDELGLEFAESSLHNSLSNLTLRQILEIFDLLVKNQDPDGSRTLYTYLFTKSSTSKRFEFLIESAAAGKGLDEVIHLFGSPMPQSTSVHIAHITDNVEYDLESYEGTVEDNAELEDIVAQQIKQHDEGKNDDQQVMTDNVQGYDGNQTSLSGVDELMEENDEESQEINAVENGETSQPVEAVAADLEVESNYLIAAEESKYLPNAADTNDSDPNPFTHLELDETEETSVDETGHEKIQSTPGQPDKDKANLSMVGSGTNNTLVHTAKTMSALADMSRHHGLDKGKNDEALADEDELAEIDWRNDEPESTSDTLQDLPSTPSRLSKRPRFDDEQNLEEEQGIKRRRPDHLYPAN